MDHAAERTLEELRELYRAYEVQFQAMEEKRKPLEGAFGLGGGPGSYPCHSQFAEDLERRLAAASAPDPKVVRSVLEEIYLAAPAARRSGPGAVYWMTLAVHSLTMDWIPLLEPADARTLYDQYRAAYPRRSLLPAQEKVLAALKKRGKA